MKLSHSLRIAALTAACGLASPAAFAEDTAPQDILRGPDIQDRDVPGSPGTFGETNSRDRKRPGAGDHRAKHRAFMGAIHSLESDDIAPDLRLTEDQQKQIKSISDEMKSAIDAYRAEHKQEIDELRAKARDNRPERGESGAKGEGKPGEGKGKREGQRGAPGEGKGKPGADADKSANPEAVEARAKLKAIMEAAPKPEQYSTRMWAVLSAPQQAYVQARIDNQRDEMRDQMNDRGPERNRDNDRARNRERRGQDGADRPNRRGAPDDAPPPPPVGANATGARFAPPPPSATGVGSPSADRFERLRRRFDELPPEAQDRILARIEEMLQRMDDRRGPRPAPSMDEIDVPRPRDAAPPPQTH